MVGERPTLPASGNATHPDTAGRRPLGFLVADHDGIAGELLDRVRDTRCAVGISQSIRERMRERPARTARRAEARPATHLLEFLEVLRRVERRLAEHERARVEPLR